MPKDLKELPKLRDSISYIYIEHAVIEQNDSSIVLIQADGRTPVPVSSLTCLMLGPGTRITHAAIRAAADNGCMIVWCGDHATHFYASGIGETRSAANLLTQARLCMNEKDHVAVVRRMYERRFPKLPDRNLTIRQIRGMEGIRVRQAYQLASKQTGIPWKARSYKQDEWDQADPINRALSIGNAMLYHVCHAGIVSLGYSPALGFVHTGKMLSFVYDIADLYKADITIPAAFEAVRASGNDLEQQVRLACRRMMHRYGLLRRLADDIAWIFDISAENEQENADSVGELWDSSGNIAGGKNHGNEGYIE